MSKGPMHQRHGTGRLNMPFVGIPSFLRAAICTNLGDLDADIVVDNPPHATFKGEDAQLDAAVKYLKDKIKAEPIEPPKAPVHPNRALKLK